MSSNEDKLFVELYIPSSEKLDDAIEDGVCNQSTNLFHDVTVYRCGLGSTFSLESRSRPSLLVPSTLRSRENVSERGDRSAVLTTS